MSRVGRTNSQRHLSSSTFCRLTSCLQLEEELFQSHRSVAADTSGTLELPGNGSLPLAALACRLCPLLGSRLESGTAHSQALLAPTLQLVPKGNCSQQAPTLLGFCIRKSYQRLTIALPSTDAKLRNSTHQPSPTYSAFCFSKLSVCRSLMLIVCRLW